MPPTTSNQMASADEVDRGRNSGAVGAAARLLETRGSGVVGARDPREGGGVTDTLGTALSEGIALVWALEMPVATNAAPLSSTSTSSSAVWNRSDDTLAIIFFTISNRSRLSCVSSVGVGSSSM